MNAPVPTVTKASVEAVTAAHAAFAHHAKSFRLAANFLPAENIDDIAVLYHFCRLVDDAVDEAPSKDIATRNIKTLKAQVTGESTPTTEHQAFIKVQRRHQLPQHAIFALMEGCESDLDTVLVKDRHELAKYCYNVAGAVGELMCPLLGVSNPEATPYAIDLGLGMQITNICRDVLEDAERGRVYIPQTWLAQQNLTHQSILSQRVSTQQIAPVIEQMLETAEACYRRAYIGCRYIPFRSRLGILIARRVYRAIGLKLKHKHQANPFHGRTMLSKWEKIWQVGLGFLDALNPVTLGWWKPQIPESSLYDDWRELLPEPSK